MEARRGGGLFQQVRYPDALRAAAERNPRAFYFTVEPYLWAVDPAGPAAGRVEEGDVLLAVNDEPITTPAGSSHLTHMEVGEPLLLALRRGNHLVEATVVPELSCGKYTASVGSGKRPHSIDVPRRDSKRAEAAPGAEDEQRSITRLRTLGIVLLGPKEMEIEAEGRVVWRFRVPPTVAEVDGDGPAYTAGLRSGDRVTAVGGVPITRVEGSAAIVAAGRGGVTRVSVRRGADQREIEVVVPGS